MSMGYPPNHTNSSFIACCPSSNDCVLIMVRSNACYWQLTKGKRDLSYVVDDFSTLAIELLNDDDGGGVVATMSTYRQTDV